MNLMPKLAISLEYSLWGKFFVWSWSLLVSCCLEPEKPGTHKVKKLIFCLLVFVCALHVNLLAGEPYLALRQKMVQEQIINRGISNERVIKALLEVPRHEFVPYRYKYRAYSDHPLPIAKDQTISQPYIVALMTELLDLEGGEKVLEIGTGSGYQAAVLAELVDEVYSIEIIKELAESAQTLLEKLGYSKIKIKHGDGYKGWPEHAPYDAVIVTAAPPAIPHQLFEQLREGGRMVIPVGGHYQELKLVKKVNGIIKVENIISVRFVPMVHEKP